MTPAGRASRSSDSIGSLRRMAKDELFERNAHPKAQDLLEQSPPIDRAASSMITGPFSSIRSSA